ncbi:SDR family oxidoreductase [Neobacillus drentensis]|uniref:SDR family NAD(P)-dependent oxidoreductase n=1 Tax=Neobacillus drentensis TaxID=220684 RepID=UPI002FFE9778
MDRPITLITGSRKGIGKYLVQHYVYQGHLVIGCSRNEPDWSLDGYEHYQVDVSDENTVRAMFTSIKKKHGRLDHLINNAGIASMNHFMLTPVSTVNKIFNTNVIGTFLFCREAAKLMQKRRYGRIVNFTTVAAPLKLEGESIYAASKAAVISFTEVIARELSPYDITVNSIGPTPIETDLIRSVPKEKLAALINRQAIKRYGTVEDVANVVDFFLKEESSFITGQTLFLGGV